MLLSFGLVSVSMTRPSRVLVCTVPISWSFLTIDDVALCMCNIKTWLFGLTIVRTTWPTWRWKILLSMTAWKNDLTPQTMRWRSRFCPLRRQPHQVRITMTTRWLSLYHHELQWPACLLHVIVQDKMTLNRPTTTLFNFRAAFASSPLPPSPRTSTQICINTTDDVKLYRGILTHSLKTMFANFIYLIVMINHSLFCSSFAFNFLAWYDVRHLLIVMIYHSSSLNL